MSFIRKHRIALAMMTVLFAAATAPYLIPENPDFAVFRSGTLGALLLFGCFFPVRDALARCSRRELSCGLVWGFLFACALSLGSELFVYEGLLPGLHSTIRRIAVPVMAAPLFGALCAQALRFHPARAAKVRRIPAAAFAVVILLCWLPVLLAYFPAAINYDFPNQIEQFSTGSWSNYQPMLHTLLISALLSVGDLLGNRTFGLLLYSLVQMTLFASSLAYACSFAQKRGVPTLGVLLLTALFALHPVFSVMSIATTKDTLFAAAVLTLTLLTVELIEDCEAFFQRKVRCSLYVVTAACLVLLRSNGIASLLLMLPGLLIVCRNHRKSIAMLCAGCFAAIAFAALAINLAFAPEDIPAFQSLSVPAQQLVRAYNLGEMSEADRKELESWVLTDTGLLLHPHLADAAKNDLDALRLQEDRRAYLALWARNGVKNARVYAEAFLILNIGSWYPDDLSHSTVYPDSYYSDKGYLQTQEYDMQAYGLYTTCLLPDVQAFYEQVCRYNAHQKYPVVSLLFGTATPFWVLMLACAMLIAQRHLHLLTAAICPLSLWASYLFFGPCTLPRYVLPLFCCAPVLLALALFTPTRE